MSVRLRLYYGRRLYDISGTEQLFFRAMLENVRHHMERCHEYAAILKNQGFSLDTLRAPEDLHKIPPLTTLYLKRHPLYSMQKERMILKSTTSGTSGQVSVVGYDWASIMRGVGMVLTTVFTHRLLSPRLTNYIILGYPPAKRNKIGATRTAIGATFAAPALCREYALSDAEGKYKLNIDGLREALASYQKQGRPVRFIGFPAYFMFFLRELQNNGIRLRLHPKSLVILGGGWKKYFTERLEKNELYALSEKVLGVGAARVREFFGVVEHSVGYLDCRNHHFHVPRYSRVIIRDVNTLKPIGYGMPGFLNLLTPMITSMPLSSVITDDLATLYPGETCGCGITSPYFEVHGRAGMADIKTCAAGANELLADIGRRTPS